MFGRVALVDAGKLARRAESAYGPLCRAPDFTLPAKHAWYEFRQLAPEMGPSPPHLHVLHAILARAPTLTFFLLCLSPTPPLFSLFSPAAPIPAEIEAWPFPFEEAAPVLLPLAAVAAPPRSAAAAWAC